MSASCIVGVTGKTQLRLLFYRAVLAKGRGLRHGFRTHFIGRSRGKVGILIYGEENRAHFRVVPSVAALTIINK